MSFKNKMEPLDKLFTLFFLFSPIISGLAISLGIDQKLLWFNMFMFLVWTLYIYWYRGVYQLQEQEELSFIERARGISYLFSLIVTFILNSYVVLYPSTVNSLITIVLVGVILTAVVVAIPKTFFSKQVVLFRKEQKTMFYEVLSLTGSVSIYYSMMIAMISSLMYQKLGSPIDILGIAVFSLPLVLIYHRERKSRKLADNLANSLKDTSWMRHYLRQKKIELRKQRKNKGENQ